MELPESLKKEEQLIFYDGMTGEITSPQHPGKESKSYVQKVIPVTAVLEYLEKENKWSDDDIDRAYWIGIINSPQSDRSWDTPVPSLKRMEIESARLIKLGTQPHEMLSYLGDINVPKPPKE